MIGIQLKGRLGNQMFQYATARTLAASLGCPLLVAGTTPTRRYGLLAHTLGLDRGAPYAEMRQNGRLYEAFGCGPSFLRGRLIELTLPWLRRRYFSHVFKPAAQTIEGEDFEAFDARLFAQKSGTWLDGFFQSAGYFARNAAQVWTWFGPTPEVARQVEDIVRQWSQPPQQMAAIHVRRGDYLGHKHSIGGAESGWALPLSYYNDALERLPASTGLALFSDDPAWAAEQFKALRPWVARGNSAAADMHAMARCRYNVIANSSFSWWAAWLNADPDKTVLAPEFHLGFRVGRWVPDGIAVDGWRYLKVSA